MGLNSRSSCGTMSCSLLSLALRGTETEQFISNHDRSCHGRSTLILIHLMNIYSLLTSKMIGQHSFFWSKPIATNARGTIHLNPEGVEFSLPPDPDAIKHILFG